MRIIFSRDRPAQLDLLLRSIERNMEPDDTRIIAHASSEDFLQGYWEAGVSIGMIEDDFNKDLRAALTDVGKTVTFFCDDDIVYAPVETAPRDILIFNDKILTYSLRLGINNTQRPLPQRFPCWEWKFLDRTDFGFPASIDGHTFRTEDVWYMIGDDIIPNPTMLETVMAMRAESLWQKRPYMSSPWQQKLVGVPVNRVSPSSGVANGQVFPQPTEFLNEMWLSGMQISLDALDFAGIDACHKEIQYVWEPRL